MCNPSNPILPVLRENEKKKGRKRAATCISSVRNCNAQYKSLSEGKEGHLGLLLHSWKEKKREKREEWFFAGKISAAARREGSSEREKDWCIFVITLETEKKGAANRAQCLSDNRQGVERRSGLPVTHPSTTSAAGRGQRKERREKNRPQRPSPSKS